MKVKNYQIFTLLLICLQTFFYSQNLKNEMFLNQNRIDNKFNEEVNSKFITNLTDSILVFAETKNDSIFSIYIKNNEKKSLKIFPQDNSLYLIQEALNEKNEWKPIEFWGYSTCGNSYDKTINLEPQKIIHLTTDRYSGNFKTRIRFRLLLDKMNYFSNEIPSTINKSKFEKSKWFLEFSKLFTKISGENVEKQMFLKESF